MNGSIITRKFPSFFLGYGRGLCWIVDEWWTLVVVVEYLCMVCVCVWWSLILTLFFPNLVSWGGDVFFALFSILLKAFFFSIRLIIYGCNFQPSIWFFSLVWPLSIQFNSTNNQPFSHWRIEKKRKNVVCNNNKSYSGETVFQKCYFFSSEKCHQKIDHWIEMKFLHFFFQTLLFKSWVVFVITSTVVIGEWQWNSWLIWFLFQKL